MLCVALENNPPVITTHPKDATVPLRYGNESVVFSCEANGGDDIEASGDDIQYSWYTKTGDGGMILEGETSNILLLSTVSVEMNNTQYYCVASDNGGSVASENAKLTVTSKLTIY